ncbi:hypothetical protein M3175_13620 [Robertmurraya korlensis]|uniref:hypothetical protein n=1 Tax=Robertmurraya korlensis TaxID=519977 RepID=UPI00203A8937|nr:hypothetical protein [Robertmurraya korlensis]MCM3601776.1 hypothetical protein [Robertmurraya korlensis]
MKTIPVRNGIRMVYAIFFFEKVRAWQYRIDSAILQGIGINAKHLAKKIYKYKEVEYEKITYYFY